MKNNMNGLTSFDNLPGIDPAVGSLLGQVQHRQVEAHLPRSERSRKKKERDRAKRRKPNRINLDLPLDLKKRLELLAKKEGVPISQLVAFLLYEPVFQLEKRTISPWVYKTASGCPKFECNLDLKRRAEEVRHHGAEHRDTVRKN
jgi:macrodomain Ter protein organizer (MatP/YcbG family)